MAEARPKQDEDEGQDVKVVLARQKTASKVSAWLEFRHVDDLSEDLVLVSSKQPPPPEPSQTSCLSHPNRLSTEERRGGKECTPRWSPYH